jgi:hypothetical protein
VPLKEYAGSFFLAQVAMLTLILGKVPQIHQARIYTATQIGLPIALSMINKELSQ